MIFLLFLFHSLFLCDDGKDGKLIVVSCSPHFSAFATMFPIAEEFSKRLSKNDRLIFGGSIRYKKQIDDSPFMEFLHLYPGIEEQYSQRISYNRNTKWKNNTDIWPGVWKMIDNLNVFIKSIVPEYETLMEKLKELEEELGRKPDLMLVDPVIAGGKAYAINEGIDHVIVSPSVQTPHPFIFGFPSYLGVSGMDDMTFTRCLYENILWMTLFISKSLRLILDPKGVYRSFMDKSSSLFIVPSIIGFEYATKDTLSHLSKYVGFITYHRDDPPLSSDLLEFLDTHQNTVYISYGTSILWPDRVIEGVFRTLEKHGISVIASVRIKDRGLYYSDKSHYFDESSYQNPVRFEDWVNQYLLLSHPSIKLFIHHGGAGGVAESIDTEVPSLIIPVASDQFANSVVMQERGIGERVSSIEEFENGKFEGKFIKLWENVTTASCSYYETNLRRINKVSKLHGGVEAAADLLEEILVMEGYSHLKTFKNPHSRKILVLEVVFSILFFVGVCWCCGVLFKQRTKRKGKKKRVCDFCEKKIK